MQRSKPVVLLILDGWGEGPSGLGNAIANAATPNWDRLMSHHPHTLISGSGEDVGLPEGQMGNSEVGHLTIGSGKVIYQDLTRISKAIETKTFFQNAVLKQAFARAKETQKAVHIMGLLSPGGVHSHEEHIFACLEMAKLNHCDKIYVHAFLDGRDTPPQSAKASLEKCEQKLKTIPGAQLATVSGRYYAMDRDQRWERVQLAFDAIAFGKTEAVATSGVEALTQAYARGETDEFVKPTCIVQENEQPIKVIDGDIIIYMNFRSDRARALTQAFTDPQFKHFDRGSLPTLGEFVSLTDYGKNFKTAVAFTQEMHVNVLGEFLQNKRFTQLRLAETEKYAHVTFFFNGGVEKPFDGEERILIPSPKIATYDLQPEMSSIELTETLVHHILEKKFDFIVCNYANADMVGHTGNYPATIRAIESLDYCLGQIIQALDAVDGEALITADHGNAECMFDNNTGQPHTAHTTSLVPLCILGSKMFNLFPSKANYLMLHRHY